MSTILFDTSIVTAVYRGSLNLQLAAARADGPTFSWSAELTAPTAVN